MKTKILILSSFILLLFACSQAFLAGRQTATFQKDDTIELVYGNEELSNTENAEFKQFIN